LILGRRLGSRKGQVFWTVLLSVIASGVLCATAWASTPPSVESESVSHITSTDATLEATINPEGTERGADYQFQVVANPSEYLSEFVCPTEGFPANSSLCLGLGSQAGALPIGETRAGTQGVTVSLDLSAPRAWWSGTTTLKPGTTYHYRVIAARSVQTEDTIQWEPPIVYGPDQTFTTPPAKAPAIEGESISHVTPTDATLEAQIDTEGLETSYQFRLESGCLWPRECAAITVYPLPSGKLLGSFVDQSVSLDLNSAGVMLKPGVEYAYSVTASSSAGGVTSGERRFTTPEDDAQPPNNTVTPAGDFKQDANSPPSGSSPQTTPSGGEHPRPSPLVHKHKPKHKHRIKHKHHGSKVARRRHHKA
jgi:hypothetical protein